MDADAVLAHLTEAAEARVANALVADAEHTLEVSVAGSQRWVVRSWNREWSGGPGGIRSWHLIPAGGAAEVPNDRADDWVHPVVGLLRPGLLPVWGRDGDLYRPIAVLDGVFGPAQVVLAPAGSEVAGAETAVGTLHVDARRWLCTALELPDLTWTVTDYQAG